MDDQQTHTSGQPVDSSHDHPDTTGSHGMLLFGDEVLHLSHLPMFHFPHNFQVLLSVRFDDDSSRAFLADRATGDGGLYTFLPELFPITELDPRNGPKRSSLEGTIFRGHFERGGVSIVTGAVADVLHVVHFSELVEREPAPDAELRYLCFGPAGRLHLVHEITARPSFDHVLIARIVPGTLTDMSGRPLDDDVTAMSFRSAQPAEIARRDLPDTRLTSGESVTGTFRRTPPPSGLHGFSAQIEGAEEIWLEIDELT
ncbi:hypothetical protein [Geodermatophilus sp. CPCC 205506]|uniref:hypothetical protein n=1 Tax=Geodermatophilus sp. CPCC 205506 TaxID=2936596 RepID=UPI003EEC05D9